MEKRQNYSEELQEDKGFILNVPVFFSVIMPLFNSAVYLKEAIQSVLDQSWTDWEIIAVDDGSGDNTMELLKEYEKSCSKIKIFQHEGCKNKGVSASRNLAISKSIGNWIALLDADDFWYPEKLEREARIINSYPDAVMIYSKAERLEEESGKNNNDNHVYGSGSEGEIKNAFRTLLPGFFTSTSAVTFKKETFLKCGGFDENLRFAEDTLMFHQIMEHGSVYCIDKMLSAHRIHKLSAVSNTPHEKKITARFVVYEALIKKVKKENIPIVSSALVNTGLKKIFRNYLIYPFNKPGLTFTYLARAIKNPDVLIRHKKKAIALFILEIVFSPLKAAWLKLRHI